MQRVSNSTYPPPFRPPAAIPQDLSDANLDSQIMAGIFEADATENSQEVFKAIQLCLRTHRLSLTRIEARLRFHNCHTHLVPPVPGPLNDSGNCRFFIVIGDPNVILGDNSCKHEVAQLANRRLFFCQQINGLLYSWGKA